MIHWIESRAKKKQSTSYSCQMDQYAAHVFQWMPNLWTAQITGPNNFGYQRVLPTSDQAMKWAEDQLVTLNDSPQPLPGKDDNPPRPHLDSGAPNNRSTTS